MDIPSKNIVFKIIPTTLKVNDLNINISLNIMKKHLINILKIEEIFLLSGCIKN